MSQQRPPGNPGTAGTAGPAEGPSVPSDGELARRAARGDRQAAGQLIDRHQGAVRSFLRRLTGRDDLADDLAQETFLRLLRYAHRYDQSHPMRRWLLTIARRLSINRGRRADQRTKAGEMDQFRSRLPDPADAAAQRDHLRVLKARLDAALTQLTEAQRSALVLFHQQGLSIDDTARVMRLPGGTVKSHLHRGRAALREILGHGRMLGMPPARGMQTASATVGASRNPGVSGVRGDPGGPGAPGAPGAPGIPGIPGVEVLQ